MEPDNVEALRLWGTVALQQGRLDDAVLALKTALERAPNLAEAWEHLGLAQWLAGDAAAVTSLQTAVAHAPDRGSAWANLARVLVDHARLDEALQAATTAVNAAPALVDGWVNLGLANKELGDRPAAERAYRQAIAVDPTCVVAYVGLAEVRVVVDETDPALVGLQALIGALPAQDEELAAFALGRMYEDARRFADAWRSFQAGNRARERRVGAFDPAAHRARYERLARLERRDLVGDGGSDDARPVFVVGFPRSGTTLVEGLLAAHPAVTGLGEDLALHHLATPWETDVDFPTRRPTAAWLDEAAAAWLARLRLDPATRRVTTKLPHDLEHLWLAALLFPRAQVVWVRRDPRDVAVSVFTQHFATHHAYKHHLASLTAAIDDAERLMNHWQAALPLPITVVRYEDLAAEPTRARAALLAALGLDDAPGEAPYRRTLDAYRRGTGIHTDAVGRWRRYEREVLADAADPAWWSARP